MKKTKRWMVTLLAFCTIGAQAQVTEKMVYPHAEWSKAGDILMHTPGQELFNGVIHPSAGLFEDYFDVDKAAEEHRGYIICRMNSSQRTPETEIISLCYDHIGLKPILEISGDALSRSDSNL